MQAIRLLPSSKGTFDVTLDGELVFSKSAVGRHAEPGEVMTLLAPLMGEPIPR